MEKFPNCRNTSFVFVCLDQYKNVSRVHFLNKLIFKGVCVSHLIWGLIV